MLQLLSPVLGTIASQVARNFFPDPADDLKRAELEKSFALETMKQAQAIQQAAAEIIKAEASSSSVLASSWRPITMLTFVALIVARWFGWAAPDLSQEEYIKLWDIVHIGLGGYIFARTAEKIAPPIIDAFKKQ